MLGFPASRFMTPHFLVPRKCVISENLNTDAFYLRGISFAEANVSRSTIHLSTQASAALLQGSFSSYDSQYNREGSLFIPQGALMNLKGESRASLGSGSLRGVENNVLHIIPVNHLRGEIFLSYSTSGI